MSATPTFMGVFKWKRFVSFVGRWETDVRFPT